LDGCHFLKVRRCRLQRLYTGGKVSRAVPKHHVANCLQVLRVGESLYKINDSRHHQIIALLKTLRMVLVRDSSVVKALGLEP